MALYKYIVTQPDKELVLENEAASTSPPIAKGSGSPPNCSLNSLRPHRDRPAPDWSFLNPGAREIWRVDIHASAPPDGVS